MLRTPFAPGAVLLPLWPVPRDLVRDPISLQPAETSSMVLLCTWGQAGGTLMIYPQCRHLLPPDWDSHTHPLQAQSVPSTKAAQAVLTRPSCISEPPVPSQTCRGSISVFLPSPQVLKSSLGANVAQAHAQALRCVGTSCGAQREQSHSPWRMLSVGACRGAHPGFI